MRKHQCHIVFPGLYILCIEVLLFEIYSSLLFKGVPTPLLLTEVKLFAHADDTTCIFTSLNALDHFDKIYNQYSLISGSQLNKTKCAIMSIYKYNEIDFKNYPSL